MLLGWTGDLGQLLIEAIRPLHVWEDVVFHVSAYDGGLQVLRLEMRYLTASSSEMLVRL